MKFKWNIDFRGGKRGWWGGRPFDRPLDATLRVQGRPFDRPLDATLRVQELSGRKELGGAVQTLKQVQGDGLRLG